MDSSGGEYDDHDTGSVCSSPNDSGGPSALCLRTRSADLGQSNRGRVDKIVSAFSGAMLPRAQPTGGWYPPSPEGHGPVFATSLSPSNSREMRNRAEKQRRDRLNSYVNELSNLVPFVAKSAKRMDKTSILRLAATYLRIYQTLVNSKSVTPLALPPCAEQQLLEQVICDEIGGFMLILTSNGKVVFVSQTVENLLGHLQTDLMGQSIFSVTHPEDQRLLSSHLKGDSDSDLTRDWKRFISARFRRAGPKNETPVYERVQMKGTRHRLPGNIHSNENIDANLTNNEVIVFMVKVARPESIQDQYLEASKDEYRTRHLIDGRIITCDQRISLVAGYLIEEVNGISAFYYMHKDDVRWVMIALRQMYDRGESTGSSCYRLKSRNGQFIYLRTQGFLEIDQNGTVESFVCTNTLIDEEEGKKLIALMKSKYSALIGSSAERRPIKNGNALTPAILDKESSDQMLDITEDPVKVNEAINQLMSNLPSPAVSELSPATSIDTQIPRRLVSPPLSSGESSTHSFQTGRLKNNKRSSTDEYSDNKRQKVKSSAILASSPPALVKITSNMERSPPLYHRQPDSRLLERNC